MKAPKSGSLALIFLIFLWAMLILVGYYYTHKPISPTDAVALFNAVLQLLLATLMVILAGGVGRQLLSLQDLAPLERVSLQAALGLGILALTWLLVGLLNLYTWWSAWGLLGLGLLVFRRKAWSWITDIATIKSTWDGSSRFGRSLALICGIFALIQLFYALAPPIKWDALMYHLDLPSRYLAAEGFVYIHSNPYWGNPQLAELLYTWGIGLGGLEVANLLGWAFISLLLVGILGTISRWVSPNAAWLAVAAMLAGPSIRGLMSWAYVDGLAALFGFATLISTFYWIQKGHFRWLLWSGVFAGFAVFTKLTAAILLPALFLTVLIYHLFPSLFKKTSLPTIKAHDTPLVNDEEDHNRYAVGKGKKYSLKLLTFHFLLITVIPLFIFLPWLLVNTIYTGNPLYPYLFPTEFTSLERIAFFQQSADFYGWYFLWLPLAVTWFGVEAAEFQGLPNFYSDIGPLLVMFALPAIILIWKLPIIRLFIVWFISGWICIVLAAWFSPLLSQSRLYFVLLPTAALSAGYGWNVLERVSAAGVRLWRVMAVIVMVVFGLNIWQEALTITRLNPVGVVLGTKPNEDYLDDTLGWYAPAMRYLGAMPAGNQTLFLWEPRGLYAPRNSQPDVWIDRWYLDRRSIVEPVDILDFWRNQGFTHLLLNVTGAEHEQQHRAEYTPEDWSAFDVLLSRLDPPVDFGGFYRLYILSP